MANLKSLDISEDHMSSTSTTNAIFSIPYGRNIHLDIAQIEWHIGYILIYTVSVLNLRPKLDTVSW